MTTRHEYRVVGLTPFDTADNDVDLAVGDDLELALSIYRSLRIRFEIVNVLRRPATKWTPLPKGAYLTTPVVHITNPEPDPAA